MNRALKVMAAIVLMMVFAVGCTKPEEPNNGGNNNNQNDTIVNPNNGGGNNGNNDSDVRVTTYTPQDVSATTAKCGGDAIVVQGLSLTELGVCWSKERTPTINQFHMYTTVWEEPFVCTITNLEPNTVYYVRAYALRGLEYYYGDEKSFSTDASGGVYNGHEYVDLGLPSGTLWATCNVGADVSEGYGYYFSWGETVTKLSYGWSSYSFCIGDWRQLTKYCNNSSYGYNGYVDNLTVLQLDDDVASVTWGEGWCMPTKAQLEELHNYTTIIRQTQNGIKGWLFTSSNGNSLFLPAAGGCGENGLVENGYSTHIWSRSLDTGYPWCAWGIRFSYGGNDLLDSFARGVGYSVRPVRSAK